MSGPVTVGFDLLDRQILDVAGEFVGKVDDVEFTVGADGVPHLTALLVGPEALGRRMGGWVGRFVANAAHRLRPDPLRIPFDLVAGDPRDGCVVTLSVRRELLAEPALEAWLRDHVVARIPGEDVAGE